MTKRMAGLLLCLLAIALLLVFDAPRSDALAGPSAGPARPSPPTARQAVAAADGEAMAATVATVAKTADADEAIVDLFGAVGAPPPAPAPSAGDEDARPPVPFTLLGFKEDAGGRDAYLLHDGAVLMARAGAVLERRYRVLSLHQDAVHLHDQQTGEKIRIGYGDNQ